MQNIKKLVLVYILLLMFVNVVLAKDLTNSANIEQPIVQQSQVQDPNILAEEYLNIGKSLYKLGKYQEAL